MEREVKKKEKERRKTKDEAYFINLSIYVDFFYLVSIGKFNVVSDGEWSVTQVEKLTLN